MIIELNNKFISLFLPCNLVTLEKFNKQIKTAPVSGYRATSVLSRHRENQLKHLGTRAGTRWKISPGVPGGVDLFPPGNIYKILFCFFVHNKKVTWCIPVHQASPNAQQPK